MTALNFVAGSTLVSGTWWTAYGKQYSTSGATGVALPTTARTDSKGNKPVYVSTAGVYWAGRGGSRQLRIGIGSAYSSWYTVSSGSVAVSSGQKAIGGIFLNGGSQVVTIDENGTSGFYFGVGSGSTGSTDGHDPAPPLVGSLVYYQVPNAPTSVTVAQASLENAVNISWTAPTDNGGSAITSYSITWSYNSSFSGSSTVSTGSSATSYKLTGLTYGSTVYVKVAAVNAVATAAGSTSVNSSSASGYLTPPDMPLDGWSHFGTATNVTWGLVHTVIPALVPTTGIQLTGTASATGGTFTSGSVGISKTYTGLTIGRQYIVSGKAILLTAAVPANIYRFAVTGIGNGSSVTLTSTTVGATIPSYTFTATATSHTVEIELAETFTVASTGVVESVGFYDFALTRVATDLAYRVQDNQQTGSLVDHFDLATQSVGAYWWVDKLNVTQFTQDFDYVLPTATFSDTVADGNIYYNDIQVSFDTASLINGITFNNVGSRASSYGTSKYEPYSVEWVDSDATSIADWGARSTELTTNLYTAVDRINIMPNPSMAYSNFGLSTGAPQGTRQELARMATGATGWLTSGTTQPVTGAGGFLIRQVMTANTATAYQFIGGGEVSTTFAVTPSTQYTGSAYMRAGVGHSTSLTGYAALRWYDDQGNYISTSAGSATTITSTGWTRRTITATAPSTAYNAQLVTYFLYGGANNTGYRYYSTAYQVEAAATASTWFSGDNTDDTTYVYEWEGVEGESRSTRYTNMMDTRTTELLTEFATPIVRVNSLTWNTAQNPVVATNLDIGSLVIVTFKGTTATYRVVGIKHDITPERWMMSLEIAKVI